MEEEIVLILNNKGEDHTVIVDVATAEMLLNDSEKADEYLTNMLQQEQEEESVTTIQQLQDEDSSSVEHSNGSNIWKSKGRPTKADDQATTLLLQLRAQLAPTFDDKKTVKNQLWVKIAEELENSGYSCGTEKEGGERCRQKFSNLQKQYLQHKQHMRKTGEKKKEPPPFFEEMHCILGSKHKVNPTNLQDSAESDCDVENPTPSTSGMNTDSSDCEQMSTKVTAIQNRFSKVKTMRPKSANTLLLEVLQKQHEENVNARKEGFKTLEKLIDKQNEQRDRMLDLLTIALGKKRKRGNSDSDFDD